MTGSVPTLARLRLFNRVAAAAFIGAVGAGVVLADVAKDRSDEDHIAAGRYVMPWMTGTIAACIGEPVLGRRHSRHDGGRR